MSIKYSSGLGHIYLKDVDKPLADVQYNLMETNSSQYTSAKWWGEITSAKELKPSEYIFETEDGRKGSVVISLTNPPGRKLPKYRYLVNGRGSLGNLRSKHGIKKPGTP
ncbi:MULTISPECIES: hypothetical protein [Dehalococcoides]|uniref:Uncharacterized protein n=1 Tax=Dehalococcoides mccartyi (strain VS) TaxID=311424 RepID=D2BIN4_DEHMV|nr:MULTISPECIES: hypothetical protein [Dehalococcoides]ACZ62184.1 hypothetical protein DhcVS_1067 [Dehalococcoides mccartyi VS]AHB13888.1 hypothetical protein GY50_1117 [Dehalococcoides mccartyi GY50]AII58241.1 hypothetical protein X792_05980 [Dehalococcoides mccartyi CG1]APH12819.1 hypothetical protein ASJ33_06455 [Dehalococcoides mccartyi]QYY57758.1 hypothetical protein CWV2_001013 [Dehalococcoides mccartyi]